MPKWEYRCDVPYPVGGYYQTYVTITEGEPALKIETEHGTLEILKGWENLAALHEVMADAMGKKESFNA